MVQDGHFLKPKAFSGATDCDGIRKTMKYELSASPFVLQVSGTKDDPISIAILPSRPARDERLYPTASLLLSPLAISRSTVSPRESPERRFRLSHSMSQPTPVLRARDQRAREHARSATMHRLAGLFAAFAILLRIGLSPAAAQDKTLTVFAAASMKNALDEIDAAYTAKTGVKITASYAASSALAKQIEQGAPADVFVSADTDWMDYAIGKKNINEPTRVNLLGNSIVLIAPKDSKIDNVDDRRRASISPSSPATARSPPAT